jgi:hypothetical protein
VEEMETSSPVKPPANKRVFKGVSATDEDGGELPSKEELPEWEKRKLAREQQKLSGKKVRGGAGSWNKGSAKKPVEADDDSAKEYTQQKSDDESTVFELDKEGKKKRVTKGKEPGKKACIGSQEARGEIQVCFI